MLSRNTHVRYDSVPYEEVTQMRSGGTVPASAIRKHDRAAREIQRADDDAIVAAAPTSMATGVHLASMPLTVVRLAAVPDGELADIETNDRPIDDYELLAFGQIPNRENGALTEFV